MKELSRDERLKIMEDTLPDWTGRWVLKRRYLVLALLLNLKAMCAIDALDLWRDGKGGKQSGHRLSIKQGLEAGAAIFIPFLATGKVSTDQLNKEAI